ncbi:hypothetical protein EJ076_23860 [Mesorhizobium sp. M7D.F.Ca.US.005.01.1.1]|uniref:hypothetical protein n=1 Tax=Mesorhizobium sp. M7D.F.Ca.US.005.01.1.1 TaxID=2493678 RepID=UPI000F74E9CE|nr:hypothetical protein [Mesorhizobium sp. M7D.F.Ca.US.005.01.1.1]AZO43906.1 hypothetical protein EJ076_23860 [Mesorhizobium sp. M7D.F.Ca.US.005.01.1.1]
MKKLHPVAAAVSIAVAVAVVLRHSSYSSHAQSIRHFVVFLVFLHRVRKRRCASDAHGEKSIRRHLAGILSDSAGFLAAFFNVAESPRDPDSAVNESRSDSLPEARQTRLAFRVFPPSL